MRREKRRRPGEGKKTNGGRKIANDVGDGEETGTSDAREHQGDRSKGKMNDVCGTGESIGGNDGNGRERHGKMQFGGERITPMEYLEHNDGHKGGEREVRGLMRRRDGDERNDGHKGGERVVGGRKQECDANAENCDDG